MVTLPISWKAQGFSDYRLALHWYGESGGPKVVERFIQATQDTEAQIRSFPALGAAQLRSFLPGVTVRSIQLRKFPYILIYAEHADHVEIVRLLHRRQDTLKALS